MAALPAAPEPGTRVLDDIGFACEPRGLAARLKVRPGSRAAQRLEGMAAQAAALARPRALWRPAYVDCLSRDEVSLGGTVFRSLLLRRALGGGCAAYPFVATCGRELADWSAGFPDLLRRYWADVIMDMALRRSLAAVRRALARHCGGARLERIEPGIPADWPATVIPALFGLLGDTEARAGVTASPLGVMRPLKSVAGVFFVSWGRHDKCALCPLEHCDRRTAAYAPADAG